MAKQEWERVGGGSYGVYRKKPKSDWPGTLFGMAVIGVLLLIFFG